MLSNCSVTLNFVFYILYSSARAICYFILRCVRIGSTGDLFCIFFLYVKLSLKCILYSSVCAICYFILRCVRIGSLAISSCATSCENPLPPNGGLYYGLKFAVMPSDGQRGAKRQGLTNRCVIAQISVLIN